MAVTGVVGTGTTFSFSGFSYKIRRIEAGEITRKAIEASKMDTVEWHEFTPGKLKDPGEVTLELEGTGAWPSWGTAATGTITFPNTASIAASMFLAGTRIVTEMEELIIMSCTFKVTGAWS